MDDAPRSQRLKTTLIVGLLVLTGFVAPSSVSTASAFGVMQLDAQSKPSFLQSDTSVSITGVSSGCFTLEDVKKKLSESLYANDAMRELDAAQKDGWVVEQACLHDFYYDQNTSVLPHVAYFLLTKVTLNANGEEIGDVRVGVWDESREWTARLAKKGSGFSLSTPIPLPSHTQGQYLRPSLTAIWQNKRWTYSVVYAIDRGVTDGKGDIRLYYSYYRFDPWKQTTRKLYTCWFEDSGPRTPEKACKSINQF